MAQQKRITILSEDHILYDQLKKTLPDAFQLTPLFLGKDRETLFCVLEDVLGITTGALTADVVLIDSYMTCSDGSRYVLTDPLKELSSALELLLGAGIPTFIHAKDLPLEALWEMAAQGALSLRIETVWSDLTTVLDTRTYNWETLVVENAFATHYDKKELSGAATISSLLWENDYVQQHVKNFAKEKNRPIRILDLGCGTGRFEEILLRDPETSQSIECIFAADFAPMYLKKAKERLSHFLAQAEMERIVFTRRIAEDTKLPSNFFDVVIASFGVVCFSQFHRTIPEIHRLLKPSGLVLLNGYNRNAIAHDFKCAESLFAIKIDPKRNEMLIDGKVIPCFTFDVEELAAFLGIVGFKAMEESTQTFPTLYGCTRSDYLKEWIPQAQHKAHVGQTCLQRGVCEEHASYQSVNLQKDPYASGFALTLHEMDKDFTDVLKNRGFYFAMAARK